MLRKVIVITLMLSVGLISSFVNKDWQALLRGLASQTVILLPLIGLLLFAFFYPQIKGWIGERRVRKVLKALEATGMKVLYNVFLRLPDGKTTQIDHIGVSTAGVFVIETKTFQGWIFGSEKAEYWTQKIYRSSRKFKNPLRQNYGHVMALKTVLCKFGEIPYHSVVVFAGSAELKKMDSPNVIKLGELLSWMQARHTATLAPDVVDEISGILRSSGSASRKEIKQHIATIEKNQETAGKICPKCGGTLVERNGKYGPFLGCANYPRCRYIYKGDKKPALVERN